MCVSNSEAQLSKYTSISAAQSCPLLVSIRNSVPVVCLSSFPLLLPIFSFTLPSRCLLLLSACCVSRFYLLFHTDCSLCGACASFEQLPSAFPPSHNLLTSCLPLVYRYLCHPSSLHLSLGATFAYLFCLFFIELRASVSFL